MTDFENKPDREPDFKIVAKDWGGEDERTIFYWIDEGCREIVYHKASRSEYSREFNTNIDVQRMYVNLKDIANMLSSSIDPEYNEFIEKYENYLIERELLHD